MAMLRAFFAGNIGLDGGAKGKLNGETERDSKLCPFPQKSDLPATSVGTVRRRWENILHAAVGGAPRGRIRKIRARGDALRNKSRRGGGDQGSKDVAGRSGATVTGWRGCGDRSAAAMATMEPKPSFSVDMTAGGNRHCGVWER